jgi:PST family polysaccharide transporter
MAGSSLAKILIQIIFLAILARLLSPSQYGVVGAATLVVTLAMTFVESGIGKALVQRQVLESEHIGSAFVFTVFSGLLVYFIVIYNSKLISAFFDFPGLEAVLNLVAVVLIIRSIGVVSESMLYRELRYRNLSSRDFISYFIGYAFFGIPLAFLGFGEWALVGAFLAQELTRLLVLILAYKVPVKSGASMTHFIDLYRFGVGLMISTIFNKTAAEVDNVVVAKVLGADALGIYGRGFTLISMPASLFGTVISRVLFPSLSKIQNDRGKLIDVHRKGVFLVAYFSMPFSIFLYFVSPSLFSILLGEGWFEVIPVLQVLAFGLYFRLGYKINGELAKSQGQLKNFAYLQVIYALLIFGGALFGTSYGVVGVAYGVLAALVIHFILMSYMGCRITSLSGSDFLRQLLPAAVLSSVLFAALSYARRFATEISMTLEIVFFSFLSIALLVTFTLIYNKIKPGNPIDWLFVNILRKQISKVVEDQ